MAERRIMDWRVGGTDVARPFDLKVLNWDHFCSFSIIGEN